MIPVIIATAAAAVAYKAKPECSVCHSKMTWNQPDMFSKEPVCGTCGIDTENVFYKGHLIARAGRYIKTETEKYLYKIETEKKEVEQLLVTLEAAKKVKVWPETYLGLVPAPQKNKKIQTGWHSRKSTATDELKFLAAENRCNSVQKVTYHTDARHDGNFEYTVWCAEGII